MADPEPPDVSPADVEGQTLEVSLKLPKRRIGMHAGEVSVDIEATDDLDALAAVAERLWALVTPPRTAVTVGFAAGPTLVTEIAAGQIAGYLPGEDRGRR